MKHEYEQEQRQYWIQLRQELTRYKAELGATNFELAQCLGISRQPLVSFMQGDRKDLPINRSHLKQLWYLLTDPAWMQDKKLSADERTRRETLRRLGPNSLLQAAGYLPESNTRSIAVERERYQHMQRLISSLSNVPDFTNFIRLVGSLETELGERLFGIRDLSKSNLKPGTSLSWKMSTKEIGKWIKQWIKHNLHQQPDVQVKHKFERSITKLVTSGKYDLDNAEIFELYISILENDRFERNIQDNFKLKITQCQFTTLTFSLLDSVFNCSDAIKQQLRHAGMDAEKTLRCFAQETDYIGNLVSDVVLEASVTCRFKDHGAISWRYSSSATHFENMLAAIARGMGYENKLELVDLAIHSLGSSDSSLIKVSITFEDNDIETGQKNIYQSVWVDRSAITGTAKSVSFAARNWLTETLTNCEEIQRYCDVCYTLALIDQDLSDGRQALSNYAIRRSDRSINGPIQDHLKENVISKIEHLQTTTLKQHPILADWYGTLLDQRYCMAQLWCAHASSVEGDLKMTGEWLTKTEAALEQPSLKHYIPLHILTYTEKVLYQFYSGDPNSFSKKEWRSQYKLYLKQLNDYIYQEIDNKAFRKYCDRLEFDVYLCASDLFGRVGRLDFSLSGWEDSEYLEQSISNSLMAAYCAAKIGNKQRAAHWITTVSRAYCRLGKQAQAQEFADIAEHLSKNSIHPRHNLDYQESIMAEVNLMHGERFLLEENPQAALKHFLQSLKGASYLGFARVISESLYGIARAAQGFNDYRIEKTFEDAFGGKQVDNPSQKWKFKPDKRSGATNPIANRTIQFVNDLNKQSDWGGVADQFKNQAKAIWHDWAIAIHGEGVTHPLEVEIDHYRFLNRV
jgi:hypothetical protein